MTTLPFPKNENDRLRKLYKYQILDSKAEEAFDELTKLASEICETSICLISLVDKDRQWFKSRVGLEAEETPRDISFCQFAIMEDDLFIVNDSIEDRRFKDNPLVLGDPNIRFYAGAPLTDSEGLNMGTLCVIDQRPKVLTDYQKKALKSIARTVMRLIELRKTNIERNVFEKFFDLSVDMLCIATLEGCFKELNANFHKTLGYSVEELKQESFWNFIHPDDLQLMKAEIQRLKKDSVKIKNLKIRFRSKNDDYKLLRWDATLDTENNLLYALAKDISEEIKIKKALEYSEKSHRNFFENSQGLMFTHDLQGNLLSVNKAVASLIGYSREELIKMNLSDITIGSEEDIWENYLKVMKEKGVFGGLMQVKHKNGDFMTWKFENILGKDVEGREYVIGNALNLTERVLIESELKKAKDLALESLHSKDVFLANMSHEIRTPLNAIIGFSDLLSETQLDEEQVKYAETISIASKNLLYLVNDILDFSKIESKKMELEKRPFNIRKTIENIVSLNAGVAKDKGLKILTSIDSELGDIVIGDVARLTQILVNLISNAIKFTPKGFVELKVYVLASDENMETIKFSVKDTGIGISEDRIDKVFERFTQAENSTTREYGGTGLGLSIVKMLVELQQGALSLSSKLGEGSEFTFILTYPKGKEDEKKSELREIKISKENHLLKGVRVLLAEDNEMNQILAVKFLEKNGASVILAENGIQAIEKVKSNNFDCIIMDLQMPKMDGFETTRIIRNELKVSVPILACTAHSLVGEKNKSLEIGMNDYITKPFSEVTLINTILCYVKPEAKKIDQQNDDKTLIKEDSDQHAFKVAFDTFIEEESEELLSMMLEIYLRRTPVDIQEMEEFLAAKHYEKLGKRAHLIAGSMSALKLTQGYIIAKELDKVSRNEKDVEKIKRLTDDLIDFLTKVLNYVKTRK